VLRPSPFEVRAALDAHTGRLAVVGELDIATRRRLEQEVAALLCKGARSVVIDLGELSFIDSSGLSLLVSLNDQADAGGWTLGLTRPSGQVLSVLRLTGADKYLPFLEETGSL
jgi:anti-sigma B factor antagonist